MNISAAWGTPIGQWTAWLHSAGKPATTIDLRTYHLRRLAEWFSARDPWSLTLDDLVGYLAAHRWAKEYARSHRASIRTFYNWAHITGRIVVNPAGLLPPITPDPAHARPAPEDVYRGAVASARDGRVEMMLELAGGLGMRRGEITVARTDDLDRDVDGTWIMYVHGKGAKTRVVPVEDPLAGRIQRWPHRGWMFPGAVDGHLSPAYVGKLMSRALAEHWTAHNLRHRAASQFHEGAGGDIRVVQELLGHASVRTTQIYTPVSKTRLRAAVRAAA